MLKGTLSDLPKGVEESIQKRIATDKKRGQDELKAVKKRFGKSMDAFPKALEAAGGPSAKTFNALAKHVDALSSAGDQKSLNEFANTYAPVVEKALAQVGLEPETFMNELLEIVGIKPEKWSPGQFLTGSTGLNVSSLTSTKDGN